ncbi:MAG: Asp23/Gls24 family envelope stress response protein [Erysipelotrichaceae bacterium]
MSITKNTQFGDINISIDAIASLAGGVVTECYGVVGMASQKMVKDGIAELLKKDNYSRGVVVRQNEGNLELDLYIIVSHGIKISEVVHEVQKKVKYVLEKSLELDFNVINVFVQGVKVIK